MIFIHDCITGDTVPMKTSFLSFPFLSSRKSFFTASFYPSLLTPLPHYHLFSFCSISSLMCTLCSSPHLLHYSSYCSLPPLPSSPPFLCFFPPMGNATEILFCPNLVVPGRGKSSTVSQCPTTECFP